MLSVEFVRGVWYVQQVDHIFNNHFLAGGVPEQQRTQAILAHDILATAVLPFFFQIRFCRLPLTPQKVERVPVWMMRQAGRHIKEYRDLVEKVSFVRHGFAASFCEAELVKGHTQTSTAVVFHVHRTQLLTFDLQ